MEDVMGRRETWQFADEHDRRLKNRQVQPIWRGVGCIMVVALSIVGYFFASWFLQANAANNWIYIPTVLLYPPYTFLSFLNGGVIVKLIVAVFFLLFSYAIINFAFAILFPIQPGELDAPPLKRGRKRKR
jgi:hypothetical protein